jgi:LysR family malonate utilization transcriptional regulator
VDLTLGSNQLLLEQLHASRLDAIIVALRGTHSDAQLLSVPLFEDEIFFAAPIDSPYAKTARLDLADARGEKFVSLNDEFATAANFNDSVRAGEIRSQYRGPRGRYLFSHQPRERRRGL